MQIRIAPLSGKRAGRWIGSANDGTVIGKRQCGRHVGDRCRGALLSMAVQPRDRPGAVGYFRLLFLESAGDPEEPFSANGEETDGREIVKS